MILFLLNVADTPSCLPCSWKGSKSELSSWSSHAGGWSAHAAMIAIDRTTARMPAGSALPAPPASREVSGPWPDHSALGAQRDARAVHGLYQQCTVLCVVIGERTPTRSGSASSHRRHDTPPGRHTDRHRASRRIPPLASPSRDNRRHSSAATRRTRRTSGS